MSVSLYTPSSSKIIHDARVDFRQRVIQPIIHIVQYDKSLPILAVKLYNNGVEYQLPQDADVSIRFGKRDHTFVYNATLGCNADRTIVYFELTEQMTVFYGEHNPIIELKSGDNVAGSGSIPIHIDRNPIQEGDIESSVESGVIEDLIKNLDFSNILQDTRIGMVINLLTNINGRALNNYTLDTSTLVGNYPYINVKFQNNPITEAQAKTYLKHILGSSYLPIYDYNFPNNHYVIDADGNVWKPQWTDIGGNIYRLHMYVLNKTVLLRSNPEENCLLIYKEDKWQVITKEALLGSIDFSHIKNVSYSELVELRNSSQLIPGTFYRIIDYETITAQVGTSSAGNLFDIIVVAVDKQTFSEEAYAVHSERDINGYFTNSKLESWKIWYCLDNDTERFAWASKGTILIHDGIYYHRDMLLDIMDGEVLYYCWKSDENSILVYTLSNEPAIGDQVYDDTFIEDWVIENIIPEGKGVIFRLVDEYFNDLPYDFKNILYDVSLTLLVKKSIVEEAVTTIENTRVYPELNVKSGSTQYYCFGRLADTRIGVIMKPNFVYAKTSELLPNTVLYSVGILGPQITSLASIVSLSKVYTFNATHSNAIDTSITSTVYKNKILSYIVGNKRKLNTMYMLNDLRLPSDNTICNNTVGGNCYNNIILGKFCNNKIGPEFHDNTILSDFYNTTVGCGCTNNTFSHVVSSSNIGNMVYNNNFIEIVNSSIGNMVYNNNWSFSSHGASIQTPIYLENSSIGNMVHDNEFKVVCNSRIGNSFCNNIFLYDVESISIGDNVQYIVLPPPDKLRGVTVLPGLSGVSDVNVFMISASDDSIIQFFPKQTRKYIKTKYVEGILKTYYKLLGTEAGWQEVI